MEPAFTHVHPGISSNTPPSEPEREKVVKKKINKNKKNSQ